MEKRRIKVSRILSISPVGTHAILILGEDDTIRGWDKGTQVTTSVLRVVDFTNGEIETRNTIYYWAA